MPPREKEEQPRKQSSIQSWLTVLGIVLGLGVPAVLWGGRTEQRLETHDNQLKGLYEDRRAMRNEMREDFREIHRKLDALAERRR